MAKKTKKKASKKASKSKAISLRLPQTWGKSAFKETSGAGFSHADLQPRYGTAYVKLLLKHGTDLKVEQSGNPGITLSLKS